MLERLKTPLRRFALYRALRFAWHCARDGVFRRDYLRRVRPPPGQFQFRSLTRMNRYPRIFACVQTELAREPEPRLLSFGCATGEEVFTLRQYFPRAFITGVDVSAHDIRLCERRLAREPDARLAFRCAASVDGEEAGSFDAVFCMAVFQHSALKDPRVTSCEAWLRFADFEAALAGLARVLKPGGLLALRHADFRFTDTVCSRSFIPVLRIPPQGEPHPRFDRHNRRLPDGHDDEVVWRKTGPA